MAPRSAPPPQPWRTLIALGLTAALTAQAAVHLELGNAVRVALLGAASGLVAVMLALALRARRATGGPEPEDAMDPHHPAAPMSAPPRSFAEAVRTQAVQAMLDGAAASGPAGWVEFDYEVRHWWWFQASRDRAALVAEPVPGSAAGLALGLASGNGYRRAEALRHPDLPAHPQLRTLVLLRATDPVAPVREAALGLLPEYTAPADRDLVETAWLLRHRAHADLLTDAALEAVAGLPDHAVRDLLAGLGPRTGRWLGRALLARARLGPELLTAVALGPFGSGLRKDCAEALAAGAADLTPLLEARSSLVVAVALDGLVRRGGTAPLDRFLGYPSAAVRAIVHWGLRRAGADPAAAYRERLAAGPAAPRFLIAGLGECGNAEDADRVRPYLQDPRAKTRAAAVTALRWFGVGVGTAMLVDPSPGVVRAVAASMIERRDLPPVAVLREHLADDRAARTRTAAARLLREHGLWHRLWVDLALHDDPDEPTATRARRDLDALCRDGLASATTPIGEDLRAELLRMLRDRSKDPLGDLAKPIAKSVRSARRSGWSEAPRSVPGPDA